MDSFKVVREVELGGGSFISAKLRSGSGKAKSSSRGRAEVHVATHGRRLRKHAARIVLRDAMEEEGYFAFTLQAIDWYSSKSCHRILTGVSFGFQYQR